MANHANDNTRPDDYFGGYFGLCPVCHKLDGYLKADSTDILFCNEHRVSWVAGAGNFSSQ
jgi:hypothetical protein